MCGIVGAVGLVEPIDRHTALSMRDSVAHRGPDDADLKEWWPEGVLLGHRRLAIIDLSPSGRQPLSNEDGTIWCVFNGEIYNFMEIRRELKQSGYRFQTRTDTEVIVHSYEEWGPAAVHRFLGMFAYAIWDARSRRLLLVRDRIGIKPLYYYWDGQRLLFASEPKAILADPSISARLDGSALLDYLTYGYVPLDRSIFLGVHKLPAGHLLSYEEGRISVEQYWDAAPEANILDVEEASSELKVTLSDAVRSHLVSDVPVAAFLSGGTDSSAVTATMAQLGPRVTTVTVAFDAGESETDFARCVAKRYDTNHREIRVGSHDVIATLGQLASVYDEPFADSSALPTYLLCKAGRQHAKVALSGDGGDELFAGYQWYRTAVNMSTSPLAGKQWLSRIVDTIRGLPMMARTARLSPFFTADHLERQGYLLGFFDDWELRRLLGPEIAPHLKNHDRLWLFRKFFRPDLPLVTALQYLDLKTYLVDDILVKVDRASMAHSLEVRPALLDHRLVDLAFAISADLHLHDGEGKWVFKQSLRDMLPDEVLNRGKRGFSAPISVWFRSDLWNFARDRLLNGACVEHGILNREFIAWMVSNLTYRRWAKVWMLLMLEEWFRRWMLSERNAYLLRA